MTAGNKPSSKMCTRCKKVKAIDEFCLTGGNRGSLKRRRHPWCGDCRREHNRAYNKERYIPRERVSRAQLAERISELEAQLAEADAVINYHVTRDWPRYGLEPTLLAAYDVCEPQTRALDRHRARHPYMAKAI